MYTDADPPGPVTVTVILSVCDPVVPVVKLDVVGWETMVPLLGLAKPGFPEPEILVTVTE